ncbi:hypothetical protein NMY22_g3694 [Coprinellus aureogranulatus]|nr:hypothetical protein NMY22_g3694 [Coprinellus aureogranulatus]
MRIPIYQPDFEKRAQIAALPIAILGDFSKRCSNRRNFCLPHSTRGVHSVGRRGLEVESYHPEPAFETFGSAGRKLTKRSSTGASLEARALAFFEERMNVTRTGLEYRSGFSQDGVEHAYLVQVYDGIPFINAVANVAFKDGDNSVLSFGSSLVKPYKIAPSKPTVDLNAAIATAEDALEAKYTQKFRMAYLIRPDHSAILVYAIEVQNDDQDGHYEAYVDAHTGQLVSLTDYAARSFATVRLPLQFRVVPINRASFAEGTELLYRPEDTAAAPAGWNENRTMFSSSTSGTNVVTHIGTNLLDSTGTSSEDENFDLVFDYLYDALSLLRTLTTLTLRVSTPIMLGTLCMTLRGDKWARGDDPILIRLQTTPGSNDAVFTTPPDGTPGVLKLYVWNKSNPTRDPGMANDILVHELTHGITGRLTGGGTAACLQTTEAKGLGEGWSDAMAEWTEQKSATVSDYVIGAWINNNPAGLRTHPYSTNAATNPLRYSSLTSASTIYQFGEVWANTLHNVYAALVQVHGWSANALRDPDTAHGNVVFMRLFFDALSLQPCNPTFVTARAAWIQADENRYAGAHKCLLWNAFASRGLGVNAVNFVDDATVPAGC